jgi:hypothetical protein
MLLKLLPNLRRMLLAPIRVVLSREKLALAFRLPTGLVNAARGITFSAIERGRANDAIEPNASLLPWTRSWRRARLESSSFNGCQTAGHFAEQGIGRINKVAKIPIKFGIAMSTVKDLTVLFSH